MPFKPSLKTKMSLTFTVLVVAILFIIAALTYRYSHNELDKFISAQQTTLLNTLAQQLDDRLGLIHEQLRRVANEINAAMLADPRRLQAFLEAEKDQRVFFNAGLLLVSPGGEIMAEHPYRAERIGTTFPAGEEYFEETIASKKPFISSPFRSPMSDEPVIAFTVPILKGDGSLAAILVGRHKLWSGRFLSTIAESRIGKTGYLYIFDKHRDMVVHPDKKRAGERFKPGDDPGADLALQGFEGTMENVISPGGKGHSSFKRLNSAPWIVGSHYPLNEAHQPLARAGGFFQLVVISAGVVSLLIVHYAMNRLTAPLIRLTEHVSAFAEKRGEERLVRIESHDEIGRLAEVFNAMLGKIDDQQRNLEEERTFVENLVMNSAAPIFVLDKDHRIIYWNRALEKLTGFTAADMKGSNRQWEPFYAEQRPTMADFVLGNADGTLPILYDNFRPSRLIEGAFQAEGWYRFAATGRHYLLFQASPIRNGDGDLVGAVETLIDLTEAKQIEEMLNDQFRFLQEIIDAIPAPVYYKDRLGRYIGCNRAFEVFFGKDKKGIMGKSVRDMSQGDYAAEHERMERECLKTMVPCSYESRLIRADGMHRDIIVTKAPFYDKKGKAGGLVGTFTDITERRAMEEQLHKLSRAVEQSPVSIIITDTKGVIEYVNPRFCQLTGYSSEEAIGQSPRILKSGKQPPEVYAELWRTIAGGMEWHGEFHNRRKSGEEFWELATISPLTDKNGVITHYVAVKEDITARKLAEQALTENRAELEGKHAELGLLFSWVETAKQEWEQTLDCLRDMVIMTDPQGRIRRSNRLLRELAGRSYDEIVGADWRELLVEAGFSFTSFNGVLGELIHGASQRLYNLNIYDITATETGDVTGRVVSLNDTTDLRTVTEELQKAYDELQTSQMKVFQQEKLASIGQLAAGVAHEINNPMGFISSNLSTLGKYFERMNEFVTFLSDELGGCRGADSLDRAGAQRKRLKIDYIAADTPQLIAESQDGAQRVRKIVQDLKSFSRVDEAERKHADINECIDSSVNIAWNEIKYVATLNKDYGDIPPVLCYPQQINQVFMNLLVNAAHAIVGQGEIRVRTWSDEADVYVAVSDTGCGMPPEVMNRIFEPFYTTKEVGKGTGLGLSISYDIVKKHNGDITVESEAGKGTTFTVRIPIGSGEMAAA